MNFTNRLKAKLDAYKNLQKPKEWLADNSIKVKALFENCSLRDFVFEPFKGVFQAPVKTVDDNIYAVITQVAIINAVLAGLPGKMGVGVWVSVAFEGWMAYLIARHVGVRVTGVDDIWKYLGAFAASVALLLYGFRFLLGSAFSLFAFIVPVLNPLILAEIFVTDLVGILFWVGFQEVKNLGSFRIPKRLLKNAMELTIGLCKHQVVLLQNTFSPKNLKLVGQRLLVYLKGDFPVDTKVINGDVFATAAMAYLLAGHYEKLQGPLGETFITAIRMRWSAQFDESTPLEEIAERFRDYDEDQLEGVINTVKGKMFEILATEQENLDGDNWHAKMHTDEYFPGSDIVFIDVETGEQVEVSLKAASEGNEQIIEHALARYPDIPIMTTDEVAALYEGDARVFGSGILHDELEQVTQSNFDELVRKIEPINEHQVVVGGVTIGTLAALWPFVMAYLRGNIDQSQLEAIFKKILGESGVKLVARLSYASIFGPLFAWYLLARGVRGVVTLGQSHTVQRCSFYAPSQDFQVV